MSLPIFNLGVIRESRDDESRSPLAPKHISKLKKKYPNIEIIIQPSNKRCFHNEEFKKIGAIINENLNDCDLILGVKEVDTKYLINNKKYLFFSHTSKIQPNNSAATQGTPGMDKRNLLKEILRKNITLIDYENIRSKQGSRYLGFGKFAGIIGCYNSLCLYESFINTNKLQRSYDLKTYSNLKVYLKNKFFTKMKLILTGDGRVAKGALELLKLTNIKQVTKNDFLKKKFEFPVFCNLETSDYIESHSKEKFNLKDFIKYPKKYRSIADEYLKEASILISAHYWDPNSPKIFELENLKDYKQMKVIGDITCDINGSIPTTLKSTSIENPYFYFDKSTYKEVVNSKNALAIMAVDNLPSELPRDSSEEFGNAILKEVLPYIIKDDDGRIHDATIAQNGIFLSKYLFLKKYISA